MWLVCDTMRAPQLFLLEDVDCGSRKHSRFSKDWSLTSRIKSERRHKRKTNKNTRSTYLNVTPEFFWTWKHDAGVFSIWRQKFAPQNKPSRSSNKNFRCVIKSETGYWEDLGRRGMKWRDVGENCIMRKLRNFMYLYCTHMYCIVLWMFMYFVFVNIATGHKPNYS
jgi:hypothetical protein